MISLISLPLSHITCDSSFSHRLRGAKSAQSKIWTLEKKVRSKGWDEGKGVLGLSYQKLLLWEKLEHWIDSPNAVSSELARSKRMTFPQRHWQLQIHLNPADLWGKKYEKAVAKWIYRWALLQKFKKVEVVAHEIVRNWAAAKHRHVRPSNQRLLSFCPFPLQHCEQLLRKWRHKRFYFARCLPTFFLAANWKKQFVVTEWRAVRTAAEVSGRSPGNAPHCSPLKQKIWGKSFCRCRWIVRVSFPVLMYLQIAAGASEQPCLSYFHFTQL